MLNSGPRSKWEHRLLPISISYLPVVAAGVALTFYCEVGAHPGGGPEDMTFKRTALVPPLFLPALLIAAAAVARKPGLKARRAAC